MAEDKIVSDDGENTIGRNIRWLRKSKEIRMTELVARLQVYQVAITREALVKIEGGRQHIKLSQLRGLKKVLGVSYEDILDEKRESKKSKESKESKETDYGTLRRHRQTGRLQKKLAAGKRGKSGSGHKSSDE